MEVLFNIDRDVRAGSPSGSTAVVLWIHIFNSNKARGSPLLCSGVQEQIRQCISILEGICVHMVVTK